MAIRSSKEIGPLQESISECGSFGCIRSMSAYGRKLPFDLLNIERSERPLLMKPDIQHRALKIQVPSGCFTPESSHSSQDNLQAAILKVRKDMYRLAFLLNRTHEIY